MSIPSVLYLLNESGEVYSLKDETISKFDSCGALFKKIDAGKTAIWAIGENNLVYIFVHKRDLPLVVTEESFENQRWNPKDGFSSKLLPTDRPQFSSENGLVDRSLNRIDLPSLAWEWESDWAVCSRLGSLPLDYEGWMYALDFPRTYHPEKKWNSYVRRRKWFRRRKFLSFDTWVPVTSPSNFTSGDEFIIDLAVGGSSFKGKEQFFLSVWIVTVQGKVAFRSNITEQSPEGTDWLIVSTPYGANMAQISVGPTGIVWTLTWDGDAFIRTGIDPYRPEGTGWLQIIAPGSPLASISVGLYTVWATTRDTRVWFRKGVRKRRSHSNDADSAGECWCPVDGGMKVVSTTPADQVFAIGYEDYQLYFRTGIKEDNLCGDLWIRVNIRQSDEDEGTSIASLSIGSRDEWMKESQRDEILNTTNEGVSISYDISVDNVKRDSMGEPSLTNKHKLDDPCQQQYLVGSEPIVDIMKKAALGELELETQLEPNIHLQKEGFFRLDSQISCTDSQILSQSDVFYDAIPGSLSLQETIAAMSEVHVSKNSLPKESVNELMEDHIQQRIEDRNCEIPQTVKENVINEENVSLILPIKVNLPPPIELEISQERSLSNRRESSVTSYSVASTVQLFDYNWISISAGAYHLSSEKLPDWCRVRQKQDTTSARSWDVAAVKSTQKFSSQEKASPKPEKKGVTAGSGFWYLEGRWHGCKFDLECWEDKDGVLSIFTRSKRSQVNVHNIVYCTIVYDFGKNHLCLLTRKNLSSPVRLSSSQETENELWLSYITHVCRLSHHLIGNFDTRGIYAVTSRNALLLSSAVQPNEDEARIEDLCTSALSSLPVQWNLKHGFYPGSTISFIGTVPPASTRFCIDLTCDPHKPEGNVAFHLNPRFLESEYCVVRNSRIDGVWGDEERDGDFHLDISGGDISIEIECREDCYKVSMNNVDAYTFLHRVPFEKVKCLKIGGDVIVRSVKYTAEKPTLKPLERFFHQISGHFKRIENHESGIVWGIGCDGNVWVHTGGYNGPWPCETGLEESSGKINSLTDFKAFEIYENQRWNLKHGFSNVLLPTDRPPWSDITGLIKLDKVKVTLPSANFSWISDWTVDQDLASGTDSDGWQYAVDFPATYHSHKTILDFVRRRKWIRKCQISVDGPWERQGFSTLIDVSIKPGKCYGDEIGVWAVTTAGCLIYRKGVTPSSPLGTEWESVSTEQPVICVSAGLQTEVWCVSKDGSPMIRSGINSSFPMGRYWLYIEKPKDFALSKVSVGLNAVWALDVNFNLYFRREVSSQYPEGTAWELVSENVIDFSVGQNNQVWAILDKKGCKKSGITMLTRRTLLGDDNPVGVGWETGIVGYWTAICTKGDIV